MIKLKRNRGLTTLGGKSGGGRNSSLILNNQQKFKIRKPGNFEQVGAMSSDLNEAMGSGMMITQLPDDGEVFD